VNRRDDRLNLRFSVLFVTRRETGRGIAEDHTVIDAKSFDPALLAERQRDEKSQLDQLGDREMPVQFLPQSIVGNVGVPRDRAGIGQRDFLPLAELVRVTEVEQVIVFFFR